MDHAYSGDLRQLINKFRTEGKSMSHQEILHLFQQMCQAVQFLHDLHPGHPGQCAIYPHGLRFQDAQEEATSILEEELKETDFLKWLDACRSMLRSSGNNVISRLSNILEISNLTPKYNGTKLKYQTILFDGFSVHRCVKYFDNKDRYKSMKSNLGVSQHMAILSLRAMGVGPGNWGRFRGPFGKYFWYLH